MRENAFAFVLAGNLFYVASEVILKYFGTSATLIEISLVRFACGMPLLAFAAWKSFRGIHVFTFAAVNVVNSIAGYGAILFGAYQGFAVASQLRPAMIAAASVAIFRERISQRDIVVIASCAFLSLAIGGFDGSVFSAWTLIFLATVFAQSMTFAAIGHTKLNTSTLAYVAFYNLFGFAVTFVLAAYQWQFSFAGEWREWAVLLSSGLAGLAGSICVVAGLQATQKARNVAATYIRFPISLAIAAVLFGEQLGLVTLAASAGIVIIVAWAGSKSQGK